MCCVQRVREDGFVCFSEKKKKKREKVDGHGGDWGA